MSNNIVISNVLAQQTATIQCEIEWLNIFEAILKQTPPPTLAISQGQLSAILRSLLYKLQYNVLSLKISLIC